MTKCVLKYYSKMRNIHVWTLKAHSVRPDELSLLRGKCRAYAHGNLSSLLHGFRLSGWHPLFKGFMPLNLISANGLNRLYVDPDINTL